jgi:hypothetical protein
VRRVKRVRRVVLVGSFAIALLGELRLAEASIGVIPPVSALFTSVDEIFSHRQ